MAEIWRAKNHLLKKKWAYSKIKKKGAYCLIKKTILKIKKGQKNKYRKIKKKRVAKTKFAIEKKKGDTKKPKNSGEMGTKKNAKFC